MMFLLSSLIDYISVCFTSTADDDDDDDDEDDDDDNDILSFSLTFLLVV
jgi:hypothetical protein